MTKDMASDTWDLTSLFKTRDEWEVAYNEAMAAFSAFAQYKGHLQDGADTLLAALRAYEAADIKAEAVAEYAQLLYCACLTDNAAQEMRGKVQVLLVEAGEKTSFAESEILSIDSDKINEWMEREAFAPYRVYLMRLLRQRAHILSEKEERILSLQGEAAQSVNTAFGALTNADMGFGKVSVDGKERPLTQGTWGSFMENPCRDVRQEAYHKFYSVFASHSQTLSALYAGQVAQDVFIARARGYSSCLQRALYEDNVDEKVYRSLIDTVHKNLPALHRYYAIMQRALGVEELRHYDVYAPWQADGEPCRIPYDEAVDICTKALSPLGAEYTAALRHGLLEARWVDRYERHGKRSGAFSAGTYRSNPFILLNYQDDTLRDVFTIAHEGGHSMHSLYSARSNPYMQWRYSIFEAEVASTLNEELLYRYLMNTAQDATQKARLLERRAHDIVATLFRQTMFAQMELTVHEMAERGEPLTENVLRAEYRKLLVEYFGSAMHLEDNSDMEGLRIPHFYSAFYVYKYATGMSAALAIANRICTGSEDARKAAVDDYMTFLHSGGSRWPLDALKAAGVDMCSSSAVQDACGTFASIVEQLDAVAR